MDENYVWKESFQDIVMVFGDLRLRGDDVQNSHPYDINFYHWKYINNETIIPIHAVNTIYTYNKHVYIKKDL